MTDPDRAAFLSALELTGNETVRYHLEAGHYTGKKWEDRLPVILDWLGRRAWRRVAWLN